VLFLSVKNLPNLPSFQTVGLELCLLIDRISKVQIPLRYPVADQVADLDTDLRVRVVCVTQAGRKLVES